MTLTLARTLVATILLSTLAAAPASADVTAFLGSNTTPTNRTVKGAAIGMSLLVVGFEFEYSVASDDPAAGAPSLTTISANVLLQTPIAIFHLQPYFTTGGTVYRETLDTRQDTALAPNIGGGVKIPVAGPLQLRADYRVFKLGSGALYSPAHRFYAGVNLKF